jgi:hypothetical protein
MRDLIISMCHQIFLGQLYEKDEISRACSLHAETSAGETLWRCRHRWEVNIKIEIREVVYDDVK